MGLGKNGSPAGMLDHTIWLDPVEVAGWLVDELKRDQRTMVLAKPDVHRNVTLPAGTTVTNLLGVGSILSARLPVSGDGVVEHWWAVRPSLELHLQVSHRGHGPTPATLTVTASGKTVTRHGFMRQGSFQWTALKTGASSGLEKPRAFSLQFDDGSSSLEMTGALPTSDECTILLWTDRGEVECRLDDGSAVVPTGTPPASFPAALIARLQAT